MKLLIGALSGWQHAARREMCRKTWIPRLQALGHDVVFMMGVSAVQSPVRDHDMLALPCPNGYAELPQRTRRWCQWASGQQWDYLFKCDDDTYVCAERLHEFAATLAADYAAVEWHADMSCASGGTGYFLSRRAAEIIATQLTMPTGAEDVEVGRVLTTSGISLYYREDMKVGGDERRPLPDNNFIVSHVKLGDRMAVFAECHEKLYGIKL